MKIFWWFQNFVISLQQKSRINGFLIQCLTFKNKNKNMEKKNFETVQQVADYLDDECYYLYLDTDYEEELKDIEVNGMKKFLPEEYHIKRGFDDDVVAIFATEDTIEYIWKTRDVNDFEYEARAVDKEEITNAIAEYSQYIKDGGCIDVSEWLLEKYCDNRLSVDYEVLTTIGRIMKKKDIIKKLHMEDSTYVNIDANINMEEIAKGVGETIYAYTKDFTYLFTFKGLLKDFCAYIGCMTSLEHYKADLSLNDYIELFGIKEYKI